MVDIFANNPGAMYNPVAPTKAQYQKSGNDMVNAMSEIFGLNLGSSKVSAPKTISKISPTVLTQAKSYQTKTGAGQSGDVARLASLKTKLSAPNEGVKLANSQWQRQLKAKATLDKARAKEAFDKSKRGQNLYKAAADINYAIGSTFSLLTPPTIKEEHPKFFGGLVLTLHKILKLCGFTAFGETLKWHTFEFKDYLKQAVMIALLYAAYRLESRAHFILTLIPYLGLTGVGSYMGAIYLPTN